MNSLWYTVCFLGDLLSYEMESSLTQLAQGERNLQSEETPDDNLKHLSYKSKLKLGKLPALLFFLEIVDCFVGAYSTVLKSVFDIISALSATKTAKFLLAQDQTLSTRRFSLRTQFQRRLADCCLTEKEASGH